MEHTRMMVTYSELSQETATGGHQETENWTTFSLFANM